MEKKSFYLVLTILFLLAAVSVGVIGYKYQEKNNSFYENSTEIEATVTNVEDSDNKKIISISYEVSPEKYNGTITDKMDKNVGDKVTIYYSNDDPTTFMYGNLQSTGYIIMGIGGIFLVASLILLISFFKSKKGKKEAKIETEEMKIMAPISRVTSIINEAGEKLYTIECIYQMPNTPEKFTYICNSIPFDIVTIIQNNNVKEMPIYLNKLDPQKYHIDVDYLKTFNGGK